MEHAVPSENFERENGTTFSEVPLFPEIFQWSKPKNHVPFTTQPKFPESLGKWKTPLGSGPGLGPVSRKPQKRFGLVKLFLVFMHLKPEKRKRLKPLVCREPLFI